MKVKMSPFDVGPQIWGWSLLAFAVLWLITHFGPGWLSIDEPLGELTVYLVPLGVLMLAIETAVAVVVQRGMKEERLLTGGLFALSRNPYYASLIVTLPLLCALLVRSWLIMAAGPVVVYVVIRLLIKKEERLLEANYGQEYLDYKRRVNAVFPTIRFRKRG